MYDMEDFSLKGGFKINLPPNNPLENSVSVSPKGNYLAIAVNGKKKTTIWDVNEKKLLHTLGWHKGDVLSVEFDYDESYLLTGGADGRAYLWSVELGKMVSSLPPHPDYILSGAFSRNNLWVATGSFDRMISITNISSMNLTYRKKSHRGAVTKIKFLKSHKMISGDKTGEIIVWNYSKGKLETRLQGVSDMVVDFAFDSKEEFMFVISKDKFVYLYDLVDYELISDKFIKIGEIPSALEYVPENNTLWVGTLGGSVYIFDIYEDKVALEESISKKDYQKAYELVKNNPFLKRTEDYERLEDIWDKTLNAAYKLMEKSEYEKAKSILQPFLGVAQKRGIIQNLLKDFSEFEKFKTAVVNRKYPLAYSLAAQYPSFRDTAYYKKMEQDWKKVFNKAKELIKIKGKEEEVRKLLAPFRGVSQKTPLIQALFNDKQLYDLFRSLLLSKKFEDFFMFLSRYPFLYDTPEYEKAMAYAKNLYQNAEKSLKEGNFKKAILYANTLKAFPEYKEKAEDIIEKSKYYSSFLSYLANKNHDMIEKMIYEAPFLEDSEDYKRYEGEVKEKFKIAENEAINGSVSAIKRILGDLLNSKVYRSKASQIIKSAYLNQLLDALKKKDAQKVQKGVRNYVAYFGLDNEVEDIIKIAKKLGINVTLSSTDATKLLDFDSLPDFIWEE
jgi:hypothetical protein